MFYTLALIILLIILIRKKKKKDGRIYKMIITFIILIKTILILEIVLM